MKVRTETVVGVLGAVALGAVGHFALLGPQKVGTQELRDQIAATEATNAQMAAQVPRLKAQLASISGQVAELRELSAKVPAELNLPGLYAELAMASAKAGVVGGAQNVTVTAPVLVDASAAAPAPAAEGVDESGAEGAAVDGQGTAAPGGATIASFDVTMTVKGTLAQTIAFLDALKETPRLSVVSSSSVSSSADGEASMNITAKYFLQKVDVDGMAAQIEALVGSINGAAPSVSDPADVPADDLMGAPLPGEPGSEGDLVEVEGEPAP